MFYLVARYLQLLLSLIYPVAIVVILFLAWRDWHRYVNLYEKQQSNEQELKAKVQEFIE